MSAKASQFHRGECSQAVLALPLEKLGTMWSQQHKLLCREEVLIPSSHVSSGTLSTAGIIIVPSPTHWESRQLYNGCLIMGAPEGCIGTFFPQCSYTAASVIWPVISITFNSKVLMSESARKELNAICSKHQQFKRILLLRIPNFKCLTYFLEWKPYWSFFIIRKILFRRIKINKEITDSSSNTVHIIKYNK